MSAQLSWYKKLLYKISFHTDVERALKARYEMGKAIGRKEAQPILHQQSCKRCYAPLIELEPGLYACPFCRGRATGPIDLSRPGALMKSTRALMKSTRPDLLVDTQQYEAIRLKNYQFHQGPKTRNLALLALEDVPTQELHKPKGGIA